MLEEYTFLVVVVIGSIVGALALLWLLDRAVRLAAGWVHGRTAQRIVISQLAAVVRQNLPMATALRLAAESERGWPALALGRIAHLLSQGLPLGEAMRLAMPDSSSLVISLVTAGERAGQLPAALDQAERYLIDRDWRTRFPDIPAWPYMLTLMTASMFVTAGIMVAVVPKFKEIFVDFDAKLPPLTVTLIDISDWFVMGTPPGWIFVFLALAVAYVMCMLPRRYPRISWLSRLGDWLRYRVPGLRRTTVGDGLSVMLRMMRHAVRSGMDLEPAARVAAALDVNLILRHRMNRFADLLGEGVNVTEACRRAGLGEVTATALASGQRSGNLDAALRYAADYHENIFSRWWTLMSKFAWPMTTLILAMINGFIVLALFLPLITLIESVMGSA